MTSVVPSNLGVLTGSVRVVNDYRTFSSVTVSLALKGTISPSLKGDVSSQQYCNLESVSAFRSVIIGRASPCLEGS